MHSTCNPNAGVTLCFKGINFLGVKFNSGCLALYRLFATAVPQFKICDFSGETSKGFDVL
jgi:hypothetical protein